MRARAAAVGVAIALLALWASTAAQAAPTVPHLVQLRTLYAKDHPGGAPASVHK